MLTPRLKDPATPTDLCFDVPSAMNYIRMDAGIDTAAEETALLIGLIQAAMDWIENHCNQPIFAREYYGYGLDFTDTALHSLNVTDVSLVEYQVSGGGWQTLDTAEYSWWESGEMFFTTTARGIANVTRIRVTYTAGYPASQVPPSVLQAVRLLMSKWYNSRDDEKREVPGAVEFLVEPHKLPIL